MNQALIKLRLSYHTMSTNVAVQTTVQLQGFDRKTLTAPTVLNELPSPDYPLPEYHNCITIIVSQPVLYAGFCNTRKGAGSLCSFMFTVPEDLARR